MSAVDLAAVLKYSLCSHIRIDHSSNLNTIKSNVYTENEKTYTHKILIT